MKCFPLAVLAMIAAGCAAQPPTQEAAARRHAANIAAASDAGYKVTTEDGRTMFCPSEAPIGSHLHACLTERQWEEDQLWVFNWKAFSAPEPFNVATR